METRMDALTRLYHDPYVTQALEGLNKTTDMWSMVQMELSGGEIVATFAPRSDNELIADVRAIATIPLAEGGAPHVEYSFPHPEGGKHGAQPRSNTLSPFALPLLERVVQALRKLHETQERLRSAQKDNEGARTDLAEAMSQLAYI